MKIIEADTRSSLEDLANSWLKERGNKIKIVSTDFMYNAGAYLYVIMYVQVNAQTTTIGYDRGEAGLR